MSTTNEYIHEILKIDIQHIYYKKYFFLLKAIFKDAKGYLELNWNECFQFIIGNYLGFW